MAQGLLGGVASGLFSGSFNSMFGKGAMAADNVLNSEALTHARTLGTFQQGLDRMLGNAGFLMGFGTNPLLTSGPQQAQLAGIMPYLTSYAGLSNIASPYTGINYTNAGYGQGPTYGSGFTNTGGSLFWNAGLPTMMGASETQGWGGLGVGPGGQVMTGPANLFMGSSDFGSMDAQQGQALMMAGYGAGGVGRGITDTPYYNFNSITGNMGTTGGYGISGMMPMAYQATQGA